MRTAIVVASMVAAAAGAGPATAADACRGIDTTLTEARRQAYAPIVVGSIGTEVAASEVDLEDFLKDGDWIVVGAVVPVADGEGFFFYERAGSKLTFRDVWGGMADPSEAGEIAAWAEALGAPRALARCFANRVSGG